MRRLLAAAIVVLAAAGCGSGNEVTTSTTAAMMLPDAPACADLVGEPMPEDPTCETREDTIAASAHRVCADGRTLRWNDGVIGYEGEPAEAYTMAALQELTAECD